MRIACSLNWGRSLLVALLLLGCSCSVLDRRGMITEEPPVVTERNRNLSDEEVRERIVYLEDRLDERRRYSDWWWKGWTSFYGIGAVVQSAQAGMTDSEGVRADLIVSAVKATGGVVNLIFRPLRAGKGADPVREMPSTTREDRVLQLARAEQLLRHDAKQAEGRYSWKRHLANVGVNTAGAIIVWQGFGARTRAWRSAAIGVAVGEIMIWSQPWWPANELEEYERRFSFGGKHIRQSRFNWQVVPTLGGAAFHSTF